jgi:hypothetical protein
MSYAPEMRCEEVVNAIEPGFTLIRSASLALASHFSALTSL